MTDYWEHDNKKDDDQATMSQDQIPNKRKDNQATISQDQTPKKRNDNQRQRQKKKKKREEELKDTVVWEDKDLEVSTPINNKEKKVAHKKICPEEERENRILNSLISDESESEGSKYIMSAEENDEEVQGEQDLEQKKIYDKKMSEMSCDQILDAFTARMQTSMTDME
jgi:hypothetical protein